MKRQLRCIVPHEGVRALEIVRTRKLRCGRVAVVVRDGKGNRQPPVILSEGEYKSRLVASSSQS